MGPPESLIVVSVHSSEPVIPDSIFSLTIGECIEEIHALAAVLLIWSRYWRPYSSY